MKNIEFKLTILYYYIHILLVVIATISVPSYISTHSNIIQLEICKYKSFLLRSLANARFPIFILILSRCSALSTPFQVQVVSSFAMITTLLLIGILKGIAYCIQIHPNIYLIDHIIFYVILETWWAIPTA